MKHLLVVADNGGVSISANAAIDQAYHDGVVTAVGLVPTAAFISEAAAWVCEQQSSGPRLDGRPALTAGVHFNLDDFFCMNTNESPQKWAFKDPSLPVGMIQDAMRSQCRRLIDLGVSVRYVSSRHHLHLRPELFPLVIEVAQQFHCRFIRFFPAATDIYRSTQLDWMGDMLTASGLISAPYFIPGWYWGNMDESFETAELSCAPSQDDAHGRHDLDACCDFRLKQYLRWENIALINHDDLLKPQNEDFAFPKI